MARPNTSSKSLMTLPKFSSILKKKEDNDDFIKKLIKKKLT